MALADRSWPVLRRVMGLHTRVYQVTGGRIGHRLWPGGPPMLLLEHRGARTGVVRTTPLVYVADGVDAIIVASRGGHGKNPAWYHNLLANPDTTVQIGSEQREVHAREATEAERKRLWPMAVETYGPFGEYQERTRRDIPLIVLEPRDDDAGVVKN